MHGNGNKLGDGDTDDYDEIWQRHQSPDLKRKGDGEHAPLKIGGALCLRSSTGASILVLITMCLIIVGAICSTGDSSVISSWDQMFLMTLITWNGSNTWICVSMS